MIPTSHKKSRKMLLDVIIYDGLRAFGKDRNRLEHMGCTALFSTRRNVYYVSNLWYKKGVGLKPIITTMKLLDEERESMEREDKEEKKQAHGQYWVR
jgi:hypothetical protein